MDDILRQYNQLMGEIEQEMWQYSHAGNIDKFQEKQEQYKKMMSIYEKLFKIWEESQQSLIQG